MDPFTAQISAMDMVISVDNSTIHFAGGLGKPCWAMLPLNSDWRWQTERSDTVWYDSLELFRPDKEGGWDGLIERVADRLAKLDDETLKQAEIAYLRRALATMVKANRVGDAEQYGRMLLAHGVDKAQAMRAVAKAALGAGQAVDAVEHSASGDRARSRGSGASGRDGAGHGEGRRRGARSRLGARPDAAFPEERRSLRRLRRYLVRSRPL